MPTLAAVRLQRWLLILISYDYNIVYKKGIEHGNADFMNRATFEEAKCDIEVEVNYFSLASELPITAKEMNDDDLSVYFTRRNKLLCDQGCMLWGMRVTIKTAARMLEELHHEHLEVEALARSYFWYPGIDSGIEALVKSCTTYLNLKNDPPPSPLYPWKYPEKVWDRICVDFAVYKSKIFLVLEDDYSKWLEITVLKPTTANT